MVDCLEDYHDMVDHEKCGNLNVIYVFEYELEYIQILDVVEEELELSLDEGYAILKNSMIPLHCNQSMTKVSHS